jgi:hypothetical protein
MYVKEEIKMAQYCPICDEITNCTEDCKKCLEEENEDEKN